MSSDIQKLDDAIAAQESKLAALKALRAVLINADAAEVVRSIFSGNGVSSGVKERRQPRQSKIMQAMQEFFDARNNAPATIEEIVEGTGLEKGSIRQAIYKGHSEKFERKAQLGGGRPGVYHLKK